MWTLWNTVWWFLGKLSIPLTYSSSIQVKWKHVHIGTFIRMFSCLSYNHPKLGTTHLSVNWWNGLAAVVHPDGRMRLSNKKEWAPVHAAARMTLRCITLSEKSQSQRLRSHYDILEKQLYRDRKQISVWLMVKVIVWGCVGSITEWHEDVLGGNGTCLCLYCGNYMIICICQP